mmetsp:Transcript_50344/g.79769  ORF Transcript_50344/g.79769 Transcript_50344/m.79769 type:complete len:82 (+) Transcript_50344:610-855(+)
MALHSTERECVDNAEFGGDCERIVFVICRFLKEGATSSSDMDPNLLVAVWTASFFRLPDNKSSENILIWVREDIDGKLLGG